MKRLATGIALASVAVIGVAAPALAGDHGNGSKPWICHPVEGKGETGNGWNLIDPSKASSHIDEKTGAGKHTRKDGRTDVYAVAGMCPGQEPTPSPTTTGSKPSPTTTDVPTQTHSPSPSQTSSNSAPSSSTSTATTGPTPPQSPTGSPSTTPSAEQTTVPSPPTATSAQPSHPTSVTKSSSPNSPRMSAPSTTATPPDELAKTGAAVGYLAVLAGILLMGGAFSYIGRSKRRGGAHR